MSGLRAFLQIFGAFLSWMLQIIVRSVMRVLSVLHASRKIDDRQWRVFSGALLDQPLALPMILTSAPRWNPHAVIATGGPVRVRESLALDRGVAERSASSWSLSLYSFPWHRLVATLGTLYPGTSGATQLPAGKYLLAWRYQSVLPDARIPAIDVDGTPFIEGCPVDREVNRFYGTLAQRSTPFLKALNYYTYVMLRFRAWLPGAWVTCEYVPVGSADTQFLMGAVEPGERINVTASAEALNSQEITLTQYDLASLPTFWTKIESEDYSTPIVNGAGHYLIRIRRKTATEKNLENAVCTTVIPVRAAQKQQKATSTNGASLR